MMSPEARRFATIVKSNYNKWKCTERP